RSTWRFWKKVSRRRRPPRFCMSMSVACDRDCASAPCSASNMKAVGVCRAFSSSARLVIPGLAPILKALPTDLFPLDVVDWFVLPDSDLQLDSDTAPVSPREWLLSGRPVEAVVKLASDLTRA